MSRVAEDDAAERDHYQYDLRQLEALYRQHAASIYKHLRRRLGVQHASAMDAVHAAFEYLAKRHTDAGPITAHRAYLTTVAVHAWYEECRADKDGDRHADIGRQAVADQAVTPNFARHQATACDVRGALDQLSDELRRVVLMTHFADLDTRTIADVLGIAESTVTQRRRKAELRLKALLGSNYRKEA